MSIPKSNYKLKQIVDDATPEERRFLEQYLAQVRQGDYSNAAENSSLYHQYLKMNPQTFWPDLKHLPPELLDDGL